MKKRTYTLGDKLTDNVDKVGAPTERGRKKYLDQKVKITDEEIIFLVDGVRIAKRPNTKRQTPWVSLQSGFNVFDNGSLTDITIYFDGVQVH